MCTSLFLCTVCNIWISVCFFAVCSLPTEVRYRMFSSSLKSIGKYLICDIFSFIGHVPLLHARFKIKLLLHGSKTVSRENRKKTRGLKRGRQSRHKTNTQHSVNTHGVRTPVCDCWRCSCVCSTASTCRSQPNVGTGLRRTFQMCLPGWL